jgi:hypothetical protein
VECILTLLLLLLLLLLVSVVCRCSRSSVVLTLWADQANRADLDGCEGQLLQVT